MKLTDYEQAKYNRVISSEPINDLLYNRGPVVNNVVNFMLNKSTDREYFEFLVARSGRGLGKNLLYKIDGSIFESNGVENIIYTIRGIDGAFPATYIDKITVVKENMIFREIFELYGRLWRPIKATLVLNGGDYPKSHYEKFEFDKNNRFYKLYLNKRIDLSTFCNLIFFQDKQKKEGSDLEYNKSDLARKILKKIAPSRIK